jgi:soluble cytochrome b562
MLKIIQSQENIKRVQTLQSQIKAMETIEKMQAIISDTKQIVETKINHDYEFQRQDS